MSEIRKTIYRPEKCNLQTKVILFPDQENLLKQSDGN